LSDKQFQLRSKLKSCVNIIYFLFKNKYKKIIVSGWDLPEFWLSVMLSGRRKSCLALESNIFDSKYLGLKGFVKVIYLSRIGLVFSSGDLHYKLLKKLNYHGNVKITHGVGLINKPLVITPGIVKYKKKYLFVGRLSKEKNLEFLIKVFNKIPDHSLTIVGTGILEEHLKSISNYNIKFIKMVENKNISSLYKGVNFLILPSLREPWGLVVEEALYFNLPVILSDKCGASELIVNKENGLVLPFSNVNCVARELLDIDQVIYDNFFTKRDGRDMIQEKDRIQVDAYL